MKNESPSRLFTRYQQLIDISRDLASTLNVDTILRRIINVSAEICKAEAASILLWDESKQQLYFEAATNTSEEETLKGIIVPAESIGGWVAINREPVIISDVQKDHRYFQRVDEETNLATKSMVAIPLIAKDRLVGVLEVLNKKEGQFNDYDKETLIALGAQAAIAIENARLFQQSDLIAELVHELRTPLASISTIAHLLQRQEISDEQKLNLAQTIVQETNRLNELASSFLDFARLEARRAAFELSEFNLNELILECLNIVQHKAKEKNIEIIQELDLELPAIKADNDKIKQVLLNLLSNAIKYTINQGKIFITTSMRWDVYLMTIRDTGIGIPEDDIPHLFEKFFRSKSSEDTADGTGLGLSISRRIIENHGGKIDVQSRVGEGTTITIELKSRKQ
ncbi:MAG: GAF domain-containing sensor histidine kinase [Anaerolineaceae bacterium]|nr:GAF domain-containing sensor histidine kinase [Anaerolineaceae bacterium]